MDRKELSQNLQEFKKACEAKGYTMGDIYYETAYPGDTSSSYIVKMMVRKEWIKLMPTRGQALDALIDILWETTTPEIRAYVHVISIYEEHEAELMKQPIYRQEAA